MTTTHTRGPALDAAQLAERVARIRELAENGSNDNQIAAELGVCSATVRRTRHRNDIPPGHDPAKNRSTEHGTPGMWRRCSCDVCRTAMYAWHADYVAAAARRTRTSANNAGRPWTEQDDATVLDTSITVSEAASRLGRSWHAITGRRSKLRALARANG